MNLAPSRRGSIVVPSALTWADAEPIIAFAEIDRAHLTEPFWDRSLVRAHRVAGLISLDAVDRDTTDLRLAGAIHHMTRCGSTLLVRQFSALPGVVAVSEPTIFQHLLEGPAAPPEITRRRLRLLAALHRDALAPLADRWIVKWPSLLCLHAHSLARAFPDTPVIFLHRDGLEVMASIALAPLGGVEFLAPRHLSDPVDPVDFAAFTGKPMELWARSIAALCTAIAEAPSTRALDYADLPAAGWERLASHFGFELNAAGRAAMRAVSGLHSKNGSAFEPDGPVRRTQADAEARLLAARFVEPARQAAIKRLPKLLR